MEAISSVASALTLVGAAITTGREIVVLIQTSRKAPGHIKRLAAELEDLHKVLGTLHSLLERNEMQLDETIIEMLDNLKKVLFNCEKALLDVKKIVSHLLNHNGGIVAGRWQGFIWAAFKKEDVSTLQETLSSYKAMLNLSFAALSTLYGAHVDRMVIQINANTSQNQNTLQHIHKAIRRLQQRVDNKDREEALRERRLQQDHVGDSDLPNDSSTRFSAAPYNASLRTSLRNFASIISSSPATTRAPSMVVSIDPGSSIPRASNAESEGSQMERHNRSSPEDLDYHIEEGQLLESEEKPDLMQSSEIESNWLLRKPKHFHKTLEEFDCDSPEESEPQSAKEGEKGVQRREKTLDSALHSASQIIRDINERGIESQPTKSHPSSPLIHSSTSSNFLRLSHPLALNAVSDNMQAIRETRYLDDAKEIQRIMGNLQRRIQDWNRYKVKIFGRLLLCEVLKVSIPHLTYSKRWYEVYLFDQMLLFCLAKPFQPTYYSLVSSEQLPRINLKGRIVMQHITSVTPIPNREDRNLRIVRASDKKVEFVDLGFKDSVTRSRWEVCLDRCTDTTKGVVTEDDCLTELPGIVHRSASWKKRRYAIRAAAGYPQAKDKDD